MSTVDVAVIMDPIAGVHPHKDTTLALLLEAQRRGWRLLYGTPDDIWLRDGEAFGRLAALRVVDDTSTWFALGEVVVAALGELDVILMRKDPPFDAEYVFATYILQRAEERGARVVNRPQALRDVGEKAFLAWFADCVPPTLITRSLDEMRAFIDEHERVVVKPLDQMAGRSVFVTDAEDGNRNVILETVSHRGARYAMLQEYVPEIAYSGDARILLIDGEPASPVLVRIPPAGDHRGNLATGALAEVRSLTDRERRICERVGPELRDRGLLFSGIDVIGGVMTELNVTSPTGIRELERMSGTPISGRVLDAIVATLG